MTHKQILVRHYHGTGFRFGHGYCKHYIGTIGD